MATYTKVLSDDSLQSSQKDTLVLNFKVTAAKTARQAVYQSAPLGIFFTDSASNPTQSAVDSLLGTANDVVVATTFGSTAMAADAFGIVVRHGNAKKAVSAKVMLLETAGGTPADISIFIEGNGTDTTNPADTATNAFAVTPAGNLVFRLMGNSNLDAVTAGSILIELQVESA